MMEAVITLAAKYGVEGEASWDESMACGVGHAWVHGEDERRLEAGLRRTGRCFHSGTSNYESRSDDPDQRSDAQEPITVASGTFGTTDEYAE